MSEDCVPPEKVRELLQAGKLPRRAPERTWGGSGVGADCAICDVPVGRDELEIEIEYARDGNEDTLDKYHVHVRCFVVWEHERHHLEQGPRVPMAEAGTVRVDPVSSSVLTGTTNDGILPGGGCGATSRSGPAA